MSEVVGTELSIVIVGVPATEPLFKITEPYENKFESELKKLLLV